MGQRNATGSRICVGQIILAQADYPVVFFGSSVLLIVQVLTNNDYCRDFSVVWNKVP